MRPLPTKIGVPDPAVVAADNDHDTDWVMVAFGDQGRKAHPFDRYVVTYRSRRGYRADYFYVDGQWVLGAN